MTMPNVSLYLLINATLHAEHFKAYVCKNKTRVYKSNLQTNKNIYNS